MFQVNSGDFNEAHSEEFRALTRKLITQMQKSSPQLEIIYQGRHLDPDVPPLRRGKGTSQPLDR
jgi:hypothetical protein